jgi:hypothetical protein
LNFISWLHGLLFAILRLVIYCIIWKGLKFVFWYFILTPLRWWWLYLPSLETLIYIPLGIFCRFVRIIEIIGFAAFNSHRFHILISVLLAVTISILALKCASILCTRKAIRRRRKIR